MCMLRLWVLAAAVQQQLGADGEAALRQTTVQRVVSADGEAALRQTTVQRVVSADVEAGTPNGPRGRSRPTTLAPETAQILVSSARLLWGLGRAAVRAAPSVIAAVADGVHTHNTMVLQTKKKPVVTSVDFMPHGLRVHWTPGTDGTETAYVLQLQLPRYRAGDRGPETVREVGPVPWAEDMKEVFVDVPATGDNEYHTLRIIPLYDDQLAYWEEHHTTGGPGYAPPSQYKSVSVEHRGCGLGWGDKCCRWAQDEELGAARWADQDNLEWRWHTQCTPKGTKCADAHGDGWVQDNSVKVCGWRSKGQWK